MKILLVQNTDWLRRNPAQHHHLAELLSLRGHEIRVIDFELLWKENSNGSILSPRRIYKNVMKIYEKATISVYRPSFIRIPILDYASFAVTQRREIERQVREFKPDIIYTHGIFSYNSGRIAKKYKIPIIYYWVDVSHLLIPQRYLQPFGVFIEKQNLRMIKKVFVINNKLKSYIANLGGDPENITVLGAGINLNNFDPSMNGGDIRAEYGIRNEDFILFFMGWLYHFSGLKEVIQELACTDDQRIKLLVVGDGDAYSDLQKLRESLSLEDRVILCGKKTYQELPHYIAAADVCLLPSYPWEPIMQEIVPIKLYEYMAMAKPVLSTKLPGVMNEFGQENGIVFVDRPEDVVNMALSLKRDNKLLHLGLEAREHVAQHDWKIIADRFETALEECINERSF